MSHLFSNNLPKSKQFILLIAIAFIFSLSTPPALSDGQTVTNQSKKTSSLRLLNLPKTIAGFCGGFIVGIPICFVKKLPQEINEGAHGIIGSVTNDTDNKLLLVPAALLWLPPASLIAIAEAPAYAWRDAWMAEKPFRKEQFSLTELDSPNKK